MRFGAASTIRRTTFCDRPARGGSTTTTSGLPACSTSSRRRAARRRRRRRVGDLVEPRVGDRVRDRVLDDLEAEDLARPRGERQPDRADPAEEVVDALGAVQLRVLGGDARRACSAISVLVWKNASGEIRKRSSPSSSPAAGRRPAAAVLPPAWSPPAPRSASRTSRRSRPRDQPSASSVPGEVTRRTWNWPVRRPSRMTRLRRKPRWVRRSQAQALARQKVEHLLAGGVAALGGEQVVVDRHDWSQRPGAWKPHRAPVVVGAERVLELVAVAPLLDAGTIGSSSKPSRWPMRRSASSTCSALMSSWRS